MSLAWISLLALLVVIVLSCTNRVHPGFLALALTYVLGMHVAPIYGVTYDLRRDLLAGFPLDLFLTLAGVSLLFTQAQLNGTLDRVAQAAVGLCRGNVALIPWMFFALATGFAMVGAGNIAAAALLAPTAMTLAARAGIPAALMAVVVGHGCIAGSMSILSPTGIIADEQMRRMGLPDSGTRLLVHNVVANLAVAALGFVVFGGLRLVGKRYDPAESAEQRGRFEGTHVATLCVIGALLAAVLFAGVPLGMGAFSAAVVLALAGLADDTRAAAKMPWGVILMVCGVNTLTAFLEKTGGNRLFAELIVQVSTPRTAPAVLAFVAAVVSVYSSTTGVVLPAFLPMVPTVCADLPGTDPLALALAVVVGGNLVDSSPLSTIGALCVASAPVEEDRQRLFSQVLLWGLAMAGVGAVGCYLAYGLFW